jgi:hypothetical protein
MTLTAEQAQRISSRINYAARALKEELKRDFFRHTIAEIADKIKLAAEEGRDRLLLEKRFEHELEEQISNHFKNLGFVVFMPTTVSKPITISWSKIDLTKEKKNAT